MRLIICLTAGLALTACNQQAAPPAEENVAVDIVETTPAALTTINETTWEFIDTETGKPMQESVDAAGKYIVNSGTEHVDHGTAVMKGGKACFTSAMTKEGEVCWTDPMLAVGQSGETTSDKGEKLTVKRVAYTPMTM